MFKQISYAYPSSTYAKRFDRSAQGCYVIKIKPDWRRGIVSNLRGPFDTLEAAEGHASVIQCDYAPHSMRADQAASE